MVDYLNKLNLRNRDNTDIDDYNCGGFALNTFSWYKPYCECDEEVISERLCDYSAEYDNDSEYVANILANIYINYMLDQFPNLRRLSSPNDVEEGERLIAFRAMVDDYEDWPPDTDFHFRWFDGEKWWEKCGASEIEECEYPDNWVYNFGTYNSRTYYLGLKLC